MAKHRITAPSVRRRSPWPATPALWRAMQTLSLSATLFLAPVGAADAAPAAPAPAEPTKQPAPKTPASKPLPANTVPGAGRNVTPPELPGAIPPGGARIDGPTGTLTLVASGNGGGATPPIPPVTAAPAFAPAPDLLATTPAIQARVETLIAQLDSPRQAEATRALDEIVALDGAAIAPIHRVLAAGNLTLNLQHRLRDVLARIAQQVPDSYRKALFAQALQHHAERVALFQKWLGRSDGAGPAPKFDAIPRTLDETGIDAILALPGNWPSRFIEKFLMAGGPYEASLTTVDFSVDQLIQQQMRQARRMRALQLQTPGSVSQNDAEPGVLTSIMNCRESIRAGVSTPFLLRWKNGMEQLHPDLDNLGITADLFTQFFLFRTDSDALAWARQTTRESLDLNTPMPDDHDSATQREWQTQMTYSGCAINLLHQHGAPEDVALLKDLASRPHNPCRWRAFDELALLWTPADVPQLCELIRDTDKDPIAGASLINLVAALEDPRLDAALAARADLFKADDLQYLLLNCVLARNSQPLTDAALQAWIKDGKIGANLQPLVVRLGLKQYYPGLLDDCFDPGNQRLSYDVNPSPAYQLLLTDETLVKPYLYAIDDVLGENRTDYKENSHYPKALFDTLREKFKNSANPNEIYIRARLVADARLMLAACGDPTMEAKIAAVMANFQNNGNNNRRLEMDQVQMMWYGRLLPRFPLPSLTAQLRKINPRFLENGGSDPSQACDPSELRAMLLSQQANPAPYYQRRQVRFNANRSPFLGPNGGQGPTPAGLIPLNYDHTARFDLALNYHSPDIALESYLGHPDQFKDSPDELSRLASSVTDIGKPGPGAAILEERIRLEPDNATLFNNLAWLYATSLDPAWCKTDRAVAYADRSVRLSPAQSFSMDTRAYARLAAGRYADALADFEASYRLTPLGDQTSMAGSLARQARALHFLKRDDEALARLSMARRLFPNDGDTLCWIARGYGLLGRKDEALRILAQCESGGYMFHEQLEKNPDFACIQHERLFLKIIDNMKRHRALVRDILLEATPVSELPADVDNAVDAGDEDPNDYNPRLRDLE
ncbi:MAG TPA: hypothetical protein VL860_00115 [Planctomycetota bacterium]|nr:hypothetical protein [Planctomycetota bacterium]